MDSLSRLEIDKGSLEPIQYFYFAPWDKKTPYRVEINKSNKDQQALTYTRDLNIYSPINTICIYIDTSSLFEKKSYRIGIGLITIDPSIQRYSYKDKYNLRGQQIVYNRELDGEIRAIEYGPIENTRGIPDSFYPGYKGRNMPDTP